MQLTVVVTCSERKTSPSAPDLRVRSLPLTSAQARSELWLSRLAKHAGGSALIDLYCGEHWSQVQRLMATARRRGFAPDLWIASAGLGLQPASAVAPSYAATFTRGQADSVAADTKNAAQWWGSLQDGWGRATLVELGRRGSLLIVLSDPYRQALQHELRVLAAGETDVVLIGGTEEFPGLRSIPAEGSLRRALGGTLTSLNVRMAGRWLDLVHGRCLFGDSTLSAWRNWADSVAVSERYNRTPLEDQAVIDFIQKRIAVLPGLSCSRLLRTLRDEGMACEQRRFAVLHRQAMGMI